MKPPRPYRQKLRIPTWAYVVVLLLVLSVARHWRTTPTAPPVAKTSPAVTLKRVVDGDTLLLTNGERVRLIGVDTPETVKEDAPVEPWGPEASDFTRRFTSQGKLRLEFDRERRDDYGRTLAYVYVDDRLLNEELLREGLARYLGRHEYSQEKKARFRAAQEEARRARRGIWSEPSREPSGRRPG